MPRNAKGVGYQHTDTSEDAADSIRPDRMHARILSCLDGLLFGATTHEVAQAFAVPVAKVQPRMSELVTANRIRDSGMRRKNSSGRSAIVYEITKEKADA